MEPFHQWRSQDFFRGGADFDDVEGWQIFPKGSGFCPKGADFARGEQILSSLDQKFTNNSLKKCRTGGDAGQVRCSSGGMQNRSDAGQLGCRTGGMWTGVMQDRRDGREVGCMRGGRQDRWDAGQVVCTKGGMQDK